MRWLGNSSPGNRLCAWPWAYAKFGRPGPEKAGKQLDNVHLSSVHQLRNNTKAAMLCMWYADLKGLQRVRKGVLLQLSTRGRCKCAIVQCSQPNYLPCSTQDRKRHEFDCQPFGKIAHQWLADLERGGKSHTTFRSDTKDTTVRNKTNKTGSQKSQKSQKSRTIDDEDMVPVSTPSHLKAPDSKGKRHKRHPNETQVRAFLFPSANAAPLIINVPCSTIDVSASLKARITGYITSPSLERKQNSGPSRHTAVYFSSYILPTKQSRNRG